MADIAIFRINYKSDFILTLQSDAGWLTPFCIKFWTGAPSQAYYAYYDGMSYTHCAPVEGEPTKLLVQFDDHHLPIGDLKFQIGYHFTVADFPTSIEDEVINQASVIIEVDDAPAQVMLDFNGETAPEIEFSLPAYANEAQRIANEQARIAAEEQRIANEQARISAEETRQANEQQRINAEAERVSDFASLKTESEAATAAANIAATLANEKAQLADDKAALAQAAATLANAKAQLAADKAALAQAAATLANEKAALAQQKAEYAQEQGDAAKTEAETAHALNEEVRDDEEARDQAEQIRQQQETARQQAEAQRVIDFNAQMQQQQTAYADAEAARDTAFDEAETERDAKVDAKVADITNLQAQIGYFVCDTGASVAAKTIAATGYVLGTGGNIRIKMTNDNTADSATLNINSTGAKALFYNGTQASSTNSWEAGEVVEVYYDGTTYQASNTQAYRNLSKAFINKTLTAVIERKFWLNADSTDVDYGKEIAIENTDYCVTDYINIKGLSEITFTALAKCYTQSVVNKGGYIFYDDEKNPILGFSTVRYGKWETKVYTLSIPNNVAYIRWTAASINRDYTIKGRVDTLTPYSIVNNLEDGGVDEVLSAEQGKVLSKLASYIEEKDTSVFTAEEQDSAAITITKVGDEWIINKLGSSAHKFAGLFIDTIPTTKEYTWEIEYSSTSNLGTDVYFSTLVDRNIGTHIVVGKFFKNSSHEVLKFNVIREANQNYLTVSSTNMSNVSTITLHSIKVYNRKSVQELGEAIEEGSSGGSSSTDYANVLSLFSEKKALADSMKHKDTDFSCLLFSDLHGDITNLDRIIELYDGWKEYFTCGINVGDTIYDSIDSGNSWYWTMIGEREFLLAVGNHDVWGGSGGYNDAMEQAEYDAWIVPLVNKITGLVRPSNADSALLPYYYKDYGNIRVIVLSTFSNRLSSDLAWFTDALSDAITNSKKVIIVNHIGHSLISRSNNIQQNVVAEGDYNNGFKSYIYDRSIQGYVDAPYRDTDNVGNGFVVAVKTFMDNGGTFITWINGHCHRDFFTDLSGTSHETTCGKQAFITLSTARADYQNDNPKTWPDGTGMDSFYMFSVDEELGVFKLMKFGAETDYAMRPRKFLAYSYVQHKIVAQS